MASGCLVLDVSWGRRGRTRPRLTLGDLADEVAGDAELAEGKLVVVLVIEDVEEVAVEGMDGVDLGEVVQDLRQLVVPGAGGVLHLPHVELTDALHRPAWDEAMRGGGRGAGKGRRSQETT